MDGMREDFECPPAREIEEADRERKWFLALGLITVLFGLVAISMPVITTFAAVLLLGSLLFVSGVFQIVQTLRAREPRGFFVHLVMGILYILAGALMIVYPYVGAASVTILISAFLVAGGIFRVILSAATMFRNRGWILFNGIVALVLGFLILEGSPFSALWVIGLFVGIEMIIYGWSLVVFSETEHEEIREIRLHCEATA